MSSFNAVYQQLLAEWEWDVDKRGCLEVPGLPEPTIVNGILPMFAPERWVTGHDQYTAQFYHRMEPALQLASLLLTEDCVLGWFIHLTCGDRRRSTDTRHSPKYYISTTRHEQSRQARSEVKDNLRDLGEAISFMFHPKGHNDTTYGVTYSRKEGMPWFQNYRSKDWPHIRSRYYSRRYADRYFPSISMNSDFQEFFLHGYKQASTCIKYRTLLVFAATLVHEVAHAYWMWLGYHSEPLWNKHEKKAELGFSWETATFGRVLNPLFGQILGCSVLFSVRMEEYPDPSERTHVIKRLLPCRSREAKFIRLKPNEHRSVRALLDTSPRDFRGSDFLYEGSPDMSYICCIAAIPMSWIVDWFQESGWNKKRRAWKATQTYEPPKLGPTFLMMYQRNIYGEACVHRTLNLDVPEDAEYQAYNEYMLATGQWDASYAKLYDEWPGHGK